MSPALPTELARHLNGTCALPQLGVIQAQGEDAANFLHNQLTNDVLLLPVGQARLAAFCNAKGRMQASFVVVKTAPDMVLLVMPQDLLAQTLKRLSMFVLRAKVKLTDASNQWQLRGLLGDSARAAVARGERARAREDHRDVLVGAGQRRARVGAGVRGRRRAATRSDRERGLAATKGHAGQSTAERRSVHGGSSPAPCRASTFRSAPAAPARKPYETRSIALRRRPMTRIVDPRSTNHRSGASPRA